MITIHPEKGMNPVTWHNLIYRLAEEIKEFNENKALIGKANMIANDKVITITVTHNFLHISRLMIENLLTKHPTSVHAVDATLSTTANYELVNTHVYTLIVEGGRILVVITADPMGIQIRLVHPTQVELDVSEILRLAVKNAGKLHSITLPTKLDAYQIESINCEEDWCTTIAYIKGEALPKFPE